MPFLIAEIGINHGGDTALARRLIEAAAESGADAVKLQTYQTEKRVSSGSPIFSVLKRCELDANAHRMLRGVAEECGVRFMSTPFDADSVDLLASLDVAALKIASFDIVNLTLIQRACAVGKPIVISRGMASAKETNAAMARIESAGCEAVLLHCVSSYPLEPTDANLATIGELDRRFDHPVGFSDHSIGSEVSAAAVYAGASAIEKHFTLDQEMDGPDHALSANPVELKDLRAAIDRASAIRGDVIEGHIGAEEGTLQFRRMSSA